MVELISVARGAISIHAERAGSDIQICDAVDVRKDSTFNLATGSPTAWQDASAWRGLAFVAAC